MAVRFSIVYPTRHRPEFVRQALHFLEIQGYDDLEVVVCDNFLDPALSCEAICRDSSIAGLKYVRPPTPVGMVENWNHALQFATGDYVSYLTDKMFVLPGALRHVQRMIDASGGPDIVSWTSDAYAPAAFPNYLGDGLYVSVSSGTRADAYRAFSPSEELDRRGRALISRGEQSSPDYSRGKLVFGAYRRELVARIVDRYGSLFRSINPDYTSMVLGLTEARDAIELGVSSVVSVNTDLSNGMLSDTDDAAALGFLESLAGGAATVLPDLLVPGVYASLHNWVAHDLLTAKRTFDLSFAFDVANWLGYCVEDVHRPGRRWSNPSVEAEQKGLVAAFLASLDPAIARKVESRVAERAAAASAPPSLTGRARAIVGRVLPRPWRRPTSWQAPSIEVAVDRSVAEISPALAARP